LKPQAQPRSLFIRLFAFVIITLCGSPALFAQRPTPGQRQGGQASGMQTVTLTINLRDSSGTPLDAPGVVNLRGGMENAYRTATTQEAAAAVFQGITEGEYDAEAQSVGYTTTTEHISVAGLGTSMQVYIYLPRESDSKSDSSKPRGTIMSPKLQAELDKGIDALRHRQFEVARIHFEKGVQLAPGNPDVVYYLGVAELGLDHKDLARKDYEHALSLDPTHQRALMALGELQLNSGDAASAIITLEKAFQVNGAGWRTHFLLASAYAKTGRLSDAESHAARAVTLSRNASAEPYLLLGEIQHAQGNNAGARETWQRLLDNFPSDPAAPKARQDIAALSVPVAVPVSVSSAAPSSDMQLASLPVHSLPNLALAPPAEQAWAPLDIDSLEFPLAKNAPCRVEEVVPKAEHRLRSQLQNFEKFTATEHIEHQEIDRYGRPGPVRTRDFSYIVFVYRYHGDSFYLDENRAPLGKDDSFPTSLATIGLNNLGVAVLQPSEQVNLTFSCEGLSSVRGRAAWQLRFEEKKGIQDTIRAWRRNGKLYDVPIKGRLWVSSASFDVLRIETDLREPIQDLGLTRDHLAVDYGPVRFRSTNTTLWLPWNADMYMELHGHRYHHQHYLTDYLLFEVDSNHKLGKPKEPPPAPDDPQSSNPISR
jgi:tetratricopeptide (TPR) repeat protein